jgi:fucose 4-O-acetylase-like acetyltransferase
MPLFFFISGFLFKEVEFKSWIVKRINSLIVPYFVYSFIIALLWYFVGRDVPLQGIYQGSGIGVTWFLMALLASEFVVRICYNKNKWSLWLLVALGILLTVVPYLRGVSLLSIRSAIAGISFYALGAIMQNKWQAIVQDKKVFVYMLPLPFLSIAIALCNSRIDMANGVYGNVFLFYLSSVAMILFLCWLFSRYEVKIKKIVAFWRVMEYVGGKSLLFMMWHTIVPMLTVFIIQRNKLDLGCKAVIRVIVLIGLVVVVELASRVPLFSGKTKILIK